jgi:ATP-binding cassette, subfamily A (ABC1), member 5
VKATIALHYVFSILNPMYIPYALVYFVDRIYIACNLSSACASLSFVNYMTEEILVMIVSVLIHIPIWFVCLRIVDIKKNGGKMKDFIKRKIVAEESISAEDCVGEFEDDDVRIERERVLKMCSTNTENDVQQPVVIVKVSNCDEIEENFYQVISD